MGKRLGRKDGSIGQLAMDIKRAAYLFGTGWTEVQLAEEFDRSSRTIHRWKQSEIWKAQLARMREEG